VGDAEGAARAVARKENVKGRADDRPGKADEQVTDKPETVPHKLVRHPPRNQAHNEPRQEGQHRPHQDYQKIQAQQGPQGDQNQQNPHVGYPFPLTFSTGLYGRTVLSIAVRGGTCTGAARLVTLQRTAYRS